MSEVNPSPEPSAKRDPPGLPGPQDSPTRPGQNQPRNEGRGLTSEMRGFAQEMVEEFHMAMRSGPPPNPLVEKITPEQITKLLEAEERENEREQERFRLGIELRREKLQILSRDRMDDRFWRRCLTAGLVAISIFGVFALCWLFLRYGQAQYIVTVISSVSAFVGGLGVGRYSAPKSPPTKPDQTDDQKA